MAIAAGNWYSITIKPFTDAAWASVAPFPSLPSAVASAVRNGTAMLVYCEDDSGPLLLHYNGGNVSLDATLIASDSVETKETTTLTDSSTWQSVRTSGGAWEWFDSAAGIVRRVDSPESLGAFLGFI